MKQTFTIISIFLILTGINAQEKIFLTRNYIVTTESKAYYYRVMETDSSSKGYLQRDYLISNGNLYQEIPLSSLVPYKIDGTKKEYYENGQLKYEIQYTNSKFNGYLKGYYETGELKREEIYKNDTLVTGQCYTKSGEDMIFFPYFIRPTYKIGGNEGFREFVSSNLRYPTKAQRKGVQGRVYVIFVITRSGDMTNVRIQKSDNKLLNKEAKRIVLESSKDWASGYYEGEIANIALTIPINFVLE